MLIKRKGVSVALRISPSTCNDTIAMLLPIKYLGSIQIRPTVCFRNTVIFINVESGYPDGYSYLSPKSRAILPEQFRSLLILMTEILWLF